MLDPMYHVSATSVSSAFLRGLECVLANGRRTSPRGRPCLEVQDLTFQIERPSTGPVQTADPMRDHKMAKYLDAEFDLYGRGEDRAEEFARHAPFWRSIADPDGRVNSAYGKIVWFDRTVGRGDLVTPWEWARRSLEGDADTRQAVLLFMRPDHLYETRDVVCTMHGCFSIRDSRLGLSVVMRSNDLVRGFAYDVPWFCHLQLRMWSELLPKYPGLTVGCYRHMAHSAHVYEDDLEVAYRMLGREPPREGSLADASIADGELDHLISMFEG